jgi:hypothetical protein
VNSCAINGVTVIIGQELMKDNLDRW